MNRTLAAWMVCCFTCLSAFSSFAGGSGYNVVIVVNQNSTNSVQLGNYYRAQRNVPPQNFLRINWSGSNIEWTYANFTNTLLSPLLAMLASRQLTNQIDYIALSMDIPYRVSNGANGYNSTTAALFYGYKNDPNGGSFCEITAGSTNLYAASEGIFRSTPPTSANSNSWLVTMLAASNDLALAEMTVHQGAISDATFPTNGVWLTKSDQVGYNNRYYAYDNAIFNARLRGNYPMLRTNTANIFSATPLTGAQAGAYGFGVSATPPPLFVPGAMADNLNSFGGQFLEFTSGESTLLNLLSAGATGSYGTVIEPCAFPDKFPDPQNYLYQARGYSLGECYYQSVTNPYQGLVAGEPLAAPFALPASGTWSGLASNVILSGVTNLSVQFTAPDAAHPVQQIDLFLDGNWLQTATNVLPQATNVLAVVLNGHATNYNVPTNASIKSIASNLVATLNSSGFQNATKVQAFAHGDRIELQSTDTNKTGAQVTLSVSNSTPSGLLTTFINSSGTNFLDTIASGYTTYQISGLPNNLSTLHIVVTKTNHSTVILAVTNSANSNLAGFTQQFLNVINTNASLQAGDGLIGEDLQTGSSTLVQFNLSARGQGWAASQISANITSVGLIPNPSGEDFLNDNFHDLQPRAHLYITAGATNLSATVPLATTNFTDGYHELAAVAYEGSHVRTQARAVQNIVIKNTTLTATFAPVLTGTNSALQPALNFNVTANTTNITSIQLFSTGGLLTTVSNQSSANFSVIYTNLGIGVHPFYAIVTDNSGHQYRTPTQNIGLIGVTYSGSTLFGVDYPFTLQVSGSTPIIIWPATAGRTYNILSTTNLLNPFSVKTTVTPTNALGKFTETNTVPAQQFYRVSVTP